MDTNRKMLRDFTVEELDALPVGARFVDADTFADSEGTEHDAAVHDWTYTKQTDGTWRRPYSILRRPSADFHGLWEGDPYFLDFDSSEADSTRANEWTAAANTRGVDGPESLAPIVRLAEETPDDIGDDVILVNHHFVILTVGDIRRAARFAKSLNPA